MPLFISLKPRNYEEKNVLKQSKLKNIHLFSFLILCDTYCSANVLKANLQSKLSKKTKTTIRSFLRFALLQVGCVRYVFHFVSFSDFSFFKSRKLIYQ